MKSALLILCFVATAPLFAQTSTRCQVNGRYIDCQTSPPNVIVMPRKPDPVITFLDQLATQQAQKRMQRANDQRQAAMMMAEQFTRLPLNVQLENYDRLPPDIKAYVLNPNLLVAPPKSPEQIAREVEIGKFILQVLDDLKEAATPTLSPKLEEAVARAKEEHASNRGAPGDDRCVFVTTVLATCDTCLAGTEVEIGKLREYLESLALAEARKQGANEVEWMPFNPLRSIEGNAYRCHLPAASTARR